MIRVFDVDGSVIDRSALTFAEAQAAVGGYVEVVRVSNGVLLVNEEGRLRGLMANLNASYEFGRLLAGPVVLLTGPDVDAVLGTDDDA